MKKQCWYLFLIILLLVSCSCSSGTTAIFEFDSMEFNSSEYDADMRYVRSRGNLARNESIYYVSCNDFLWYYDDVSKSAGKLCAKPECMHDEGTCDAFIKYGLNGDGIQVYDGKVYYGNSQGALWSMELTGEKRESITSMAMGNGANFKWMIHRGYLYRSRNLYTVVDGESRVELIITRKSLGKYEDLETIIKIDDMTAIDNWMIKGHTLFLDLSHGAWGKREFYAYDLNTGELKKLIDERFNGYIADYLVDDEGVTFLGRTWEDHYVFRYNFEEGKGRKMFQVKEHLDCVGRLSYDGKYVIIYDTDTMNIDGEEVVRCRVFDVNNDKEPLCVYKLTGEVITRNMEGWGSDETGFLILRTLYPDEDIFFELWRIPYGDGEAECLIPEMKSMYYGK